VTTNKKPVKKTTGAKSKPHGSATSAAILGLPAGNSKKSNSVFGKTRVKPEWTKFYQNLL
jgi:hypothetical protein